MKKFLTSRWGQLFLLAISILYTKATGQFESLGLLPLVFGTVDSISGHPDYTQAGDNKNIPWAFSRKTLVKFYDSAIVANVTNTDYEGEIKQMGDKVVINTIPDVTISKYRKGQNVSWEDLESDAVEMNIDRATQFAFKMDKVDIKQFGDKAYMDKAATDAGQQQKVYVDEEFLLNIGGTTGANNLAASANKGNSAGRKSASYALGTSGSGITLTKTNILDKLIDCSGVMDEQNLPEDGRWIALPSWVVNMIKKSDIKDVSLTGDSQSSLRSGRIGKIDHFMIYSTNLYTSISDSGTFYTIMFGHMSAIAFAMQLTETEYFDKLETTFGKGMKGLQVYDWKVVKSTSLGCLYAKKG